MGGNQKDPEQKALEEEQQRRRHYDATNDPNVAPPLQVGAIMSLLMINNEEEDDNVVHNANHWSLDNDLLSYLGEAASVYEERIEIQKNRLLKRLSAGRGNDEKMKGNNVEDNSANEDNSDVRSSLFTSPTPVLASPQPVETPQTKATPDAVAT